MESQEIIALIRRRRDAYWERQLAGSDQPDVLAAAEFAKKVTDEYDSLLDEIKRIEKTQLVQIASKRRTASDE
jgi:hypothetical protein